MTKIVSIDIEMGRDKLTEMDTACAARDTGDDINLQAFLTPAVRLLAAMRGEDID